MYTSMSFVGTVGSFEVCSGGSEFVGAAEIVGTKLEEVGHADSASCKPPSFAVETKESGCVVLAKRSRNTNGSAKARRRVVTARLLAEAEAAAEAAEILSLQHELSEALASIAALGLGFGPVTPEASG